MATSTKKVIVRTTTGTLHHGYLPLTNFVAQRTDLGGSSFDLFGLDGRITSVALVSIRHIAFVRDFNLNDRSDPERLARRTFLARPRTEGLWVRLTLIGADQFEGLAPLDIALLDALLEDGGLFLIPPDIRSNTQRLYIPRSAISAVQLLAVITTPSKTKPQPAPALPQDLLFPEPDRP